MYEVGAAIPPSIIPRKNIPQAAALSQINLHHSVLGAQKMVFLISALYKLQNALYSINNRPGVENLIFGRAY